MCISRDKKLASPNRPTINVYDIWDYSDKSQHQVKTNTNGHSRSVWKITKSWLLKLGQLLTIK
jgi:hypothetical protein